MDIDLQSLHKQLLSLENFMKSAEKDSWMGADSPGRAYERVVESFSKDFKNIEAQSSAIFAIDGDSPAAVQAHEAALRDWHVYAAPSLTALVSYAAQWLELDLEPDIAQLLLIGSILGEVENNAPYHNNMHYRKVTLQLIRMIAAHRKIYAGTPRDLSDEQIALLVFTACVHDLGHDGTGNMLKGVFVQSRLELHSIKILQRYFEQLGLLGDARIEAIETMILCTDVTPFNDPGNPVNQLKAAYRFHFLGDKDKVDSLHLDKALLPIQKSPQLTQMAVMLHEADIATSAGLTYAITKYETAILRAEVTGDDGRPHHVVGFLDKICGRRMLTEAAQKLYAANMARIYALAESDMLDGDESYPKAENSEFLSGALPPKGEHPAGKTIN